MIQVKSTSNMLIQRYPGELISERWAYVMPVAIPNIEKLVGDCLTPVTLVTSPEILINGNPIPNNAKNVVPDLYSMYIDVATGKKFLCDTTGYQSEWIAYEVIAISLGL